MNDNITVIQENPLGIASAFNADRPYPAFPQFMLDMVSDRLDLRDIRARTNHEIVCDHRDVF
jgi:hypothetical protein